MAPAQLEQLVKSAWPLLELTVSVSTSSLPRLVSERARTRLTPSLRMMYGSTEVGMVTACHAGLADAMPGVTGFVRPDVALEIVDRDGRPCPSARPAKCAAAGRAA